jgi:DHA2 family multidrug resistance protein
MALKGIARVIIVLTTISAAIMELIDTSIVNVALADISGNLGATIEDTSWVITAYAIANVIIIPLTGFFRAALRAEKVLPRVDRTFYGCFIHVR